MKFSVDSKTLAYALNKCMMLVSKSATYPFTRNFLLETLGDRVLKVTSTDMSSMLSFFVKDTMSIDEQGVSCVDAHSLATFSSAKEGTISAKLTSAGRLLLKGSGSQLSLAQIPDEEFPRHSPLPEQLFAEVSGDSLRQILAVSRVADHTNYTSVLSGTLLAVKDGKLQAIAASQGRAGYSWASVDSSMDASFVLPQSATNLLPILLYASDKVSIYLKDSKMFFVTDRFQLISNGVHGKFPYEQITAMVGRPIENEIAVEHKELKTALYTCLAMTKDTNNKMWQKLSFSADTDYHILDLSTAEENEIGHMNWVIPIKNHQSVSFSFDLFSGFGWDFLKVLQRDYELTSADEFLGEPLVYIGYITHGGNRLVSIHEDGSPTSFVMSPLGKIKVVDNE